MAVLASVLALAACGDPPPDVAVYATAVSSDVDLTVSMCKLLMPMDCGPAAPLLDPTHSAGQGGVYQLNTGDKFFLAFSSDTLTPVTDRCKKRAVTFQGAQMHVDVQLTTTSMDISCTPEANCDATVLCFP
jgi:hypothetical protein